MKMKNSTGSQKPSESTALACVPGPKAREESVADVDCGASVPATADETSQSQC